MSINNASVYALAQSESFNHFVAVLQNRARYYADELAYAFLQNENSTTINITFAELDRYARAIAEYLLRKKLTGARAILLYPSGIDFIIAFMGCLYAGVIAVPVYMPQGRAGHWQRLASIAKDAQARIILSTKEDLAKLQKGLSSLAELDQLEQLASDLISVSNVNKWQCPEITINSLAFLQYTSGSTGQPKGVMVSHGNLLHNQKLMCDVFGHDKDTVIVSWLPLFHDMGLIGNVLHALYLGVPCYLMKPVAFLQQPVRWLQAISCYKGTTSFAPNFAYDLCVRRITAEQKSGLDLSAWTLAVNGAEPINADTLKHFTSCFSDCGFRATSLSPGYGLAEATLTVSCSNKNRLPQYQVVQAASLENHRLLIEHNVVEENNDNIKSSQRLLVSSGTIGMDQEIIIVDPDTKKCCDINTVGEIWIQSPSVAQGFWQRPDDTLEIFQAHTADTNNGPFLRTGDLGFVRDKELYITGRLKDLIIIRGRNHYPQDIEKTVYKAQPTILQQGHGASFSVEKDSEEHLVVVYEVKRAHLRKLNSTEMFTAIQQAIVEIHEIPAYAIVLIKPATLSKTSSGKIQRRCCRELFLAGELSVVATKIWEPREYVNINSDVESEINLYSLQLLTEPQRNEKLENYLTASIAARLLINTEQQAISTTISLNGLGLDSLQIVQLHHQLQENFGVQLSLNTISGTTNIKSLVKVIGNLLIKQTDLSHKTKKIQCVPRSASVPLSSGQHRLWFLQQFENQGGLYNEQITWQFSGKLDVEALEKSFRAIMQRHEVLRTSFSVNDNIPEQIIHEQGILDFLIDDLSVFTKSERKQHVAQIRKSEAKYSFKLSICPLWRIRLLHLEKHNYCLVITMHHIIVDGWSQTILMRELNTFYNGLCKQQTVTLPQLPIQYRDYVNWQQQNYQTESYTAAVDYWRNQLAGSPGLLEMPTDYVRPARQSYLGASETIVVQPELLSGLQALACEHDATLYMVLLAAFKILLYRLSGQTDIIVGSPCADRKQLETAPLIGFFLNTLVLRSDLSDKVGFVDVLRDLRNTVNMAHLHQQVPFEKIVEIIEPDRGLSHNPIFQVFFNMLSLADDKLEFSHLQKTKILQPENPYARFDLTLYLQEQDLQEQELQELDSQQPTQGLQLKLVFQTALFAASRIQEMLRQYCLLLEQIVQHASGKIDNFTLVTHYAKTYLPNPTTRQNRDWPGSVIDLFNEQAQNFPVKIAVKDAEVEWSFRTLAQLAKLLATYLYHQNVGTGNIIAVYGHRSAPLVLSVLSILKSGNAFLILDPAYPATRLITALEIVRPTTLIVLDAAGPLDESLRDSIHQLHCHRINLPKRLYAISDLADYSITSGLPPISHKIDDIACVGLTSGSTGVPKAILGRHGSLTHFIPWMKKAFKLSLNDRFSMLSGLSHDPLQREIITPLCLGASIHIPQAEDISAINLAQWLSRHKITIVHLTPAMNKILIDNTESLTLHDLSKVFFVGDKLIQQDVVQLKKIAPAVNIINFYGSTESQRAVTYYKLPEEIIADKAQSEMNQQYKSKAVIPIGHGMPDVQLLILNKARQLTGIGEVGELCMRSPFLALAYLDDSVLSKKRFIQNPFILPIDKDNTEDKIYRTGDLGYYLDNGEAVCIGRLDRQIKIHGFRIEPGEIETQLKQERKVKDALVVARRFHEGEKLLVAYVVFNNNKMRTKAVNDNAVIDGLRLKLQASLPAYMMPSAFVIMEEIPLTRNAKIDMQGLPAPVEADFYKEEYVIPRSNTEKKLCAIWKKILGVKKIGINDNFFFLGGHSLLATQLISFIRKNMDIELPLQAIFEYPSIAKLSAVLGSYQTIAVLPPIRLHKRVAKLPLSYAQQRLWFINQLEHNNAQYNMFGGFELQGKFYEIIFKQVLKTITERHEILRTQYMESDGELYQFVNNKPRIGFASIDLCGINQQAQSIAIDKQLSIDIQSSFDLSRDVLLKVHSFHLSCQKTILLFNMHHIVSDGWSVNILIQEINQLYSAYFHKQRNLLPPLAIQYADYAQWQRRWLRGEVLARQLEYWKKHLEGIPLIHSLPLDDRRPVQQSFTGQSHHHIVDETLIYKIRQFCQTCDVTLFMFLQTAFSLFISRCSNETDIVMGIPVAGRIHKDIDSLIGFFSNTLVLRSDLSVNSSFITLLKNNKQSILDAFNNQYVPYDMLVEEVKPERSLNYNPLFQIMFALQNNESDELNLPDLHIAPINNEHATTKFDVELGVVEVGNSLQLNWCFNTDLFHLETIKRMAANFLTLLSSIINNPDKNTNELCIINSEEKQLLLNRWDKRKPPQSDSLSIHNLFENQVMRNPNHTAVVFENKELNYQQLNQRANQLAHYLIEAGVKPNSLVGLCVDRSVNMVIAIIAIMKAGAAYVPLDTEHPKARFQHIANDANVEYILTKEGHLNALFTDHTKTICLNNSHTISAVKACSYKNPSMSQQSVKTQQLAYVIYTSGTTGLPKGVAVEQSALSMHIQIMLKEYNISDNDRILQFASINFDVSVEQLFIALCSGASSYIYNHNNISNDSLFTYIDTHLISVADLSPAYFKQLMSYELWQEQIRYGSLRLLILGGESLDREIFAAWKQYDLYSHCQLINAYGPTEATITSVICSIDQSTLHHNIIGIPTYGRNAYILDKYKQLLPVGIVGELYLGGEGIARGYLNQTALSKEKFIDDPFVNHVNGKLYKTGDIVRCLANGQIEFIGRMDDQVKIRGFRIELKEIETCLLAHHEISNVVLVLNNETKIPQLIAYVVKNVKDCQFVNNEFSQITDAGRLRQFLKSRLPNYMIPTAFKFINELPLSADGRIDHKALPAPEASDYHYENYIAPTNKIETKLCDIWQSVLNLEKVGVMDNFFEIGGDSILSIQIVSRAKLVGLQLTTRQLFAHQCIQELAFQVNPGKSLSIPQHASSGKQLLLPAQQQFLYEDRVDPHHFNQAVLLMPADDLTLSVLRKIVTALYQRHDALRLRFLNGSTTIWTAEYQAYEPYMIEQTVSQEDLTQLTKIQQQQLIADKGQQIQASLSLTAGPLFRAVLFQAEGLGNRLLLVLHHLIVDGISWRILLNDFEVAYRQVSVDQADIHLMPKCASLQQWAEFLHTYKNSEALQREKEYWLENLQIAVPALSADDKNVLDDKFSTTEYFTFSLDQSETEALLIQCHQAYKTQINDLLLAGLLIGMHCWCGEKKFRIDLEGHGRETLNAEIDVSETIGWFTSIYPVVLICDDPASLSSVIKYVKEQLRIIPSNGIGFGILRYLAQDHDILEAVKHGKAQILFNYLGQFDQTLNDNIMFKKADEFAGQTISNKRNRSHQLVCNSRILRRCLSFTIDYNCVQYKKNTIEQLAVNIKTALQNIIYHCQQDGVGSYTPSDFPLASVNQTQLDQWYNRYPKLVNIYASTSMQQGMLFHSLLEYGSGTYITQLGMTLEGDIDLDCYRKSWQTMVARHDIFRTAFVTSESEQAQQLVMSQVDLPWFEKDWCDLNCNEQNNAFEQLRCDDKQQEFDFEQAPLMRLAIIRFGDNEYRQLLSCHHVLTDGWSLPVLFKDVIQTYQAFIKDKQPQLPEIRAYHHYIAWLQQRDWEAAECYWSSELQNLESRTEIGIDKLVVTGNMKGPKKQSLLLTRALTLQIQQLARHTKTTINTIIQAAWACLLQWYSGNSEVVFGSTVSGRPADLIGVDQIVGLFINTLPVRICVNPKQEIKQWLQKIQQDSAERDEYSYLSLAEIQKHSHVEMDIDSGSTLFDTLVVFENYPMDETLETDYAKAGLSIRDIHCYEQTNYALTLLVRPASQIQLKVGYHAEQFAEQTVMQVINHLQNILSCMTDNDNRTVGQLSLLSEVEQRQLFINWNDASSVCVETSTVHELFQEQVDKCPDATALLYENTQLSYQQLNQQANQLAHYLIENGIKTETLIGLYVDRSIDMVVAILGIMKTGAAYVPLDPDNPSLRLAYILEDSGIRTVITNSKLKKQLPVSHAIQQIFYLDSSAGKRLLSLQQKTNPCIQALQLSSKNLSYVIYTSGSTGQPKGVLVEHQSVLNFYRIFKQQLNALGVANDAGWLWNVSYAFDASVKSILALCQGRTVSIASNTQIQDANEIITLLFNNNIPVFNGTSALVEQVLDRLEVSESTMSKENFGINFIIGGDNISKTLWSRVVAYCQSRQCHAINAYGPTETTINSTYSEINENDELSIGKPVSGNTVYVINKLNLPMPVNGIGELTIGGLGLARGYLNRPELTAERFVENPLQDNDKSALTSMNSFSKRVYKTGDLVRWSANGNLIFMGRNDQQIKIRGYRIELDEISHKLSALDLVRKALVIVKDENGMKKIWAYVVPNSDKKSLLERELIDSYKVELEKILPAYMIPEIFILLDNFPLNASGKIDVLSLPAQEEECLSTDFDSEVMNEIEIVLRDNWKAILKLEHISKDDNFFKIGGHSLLGMKLLTTIAKEFEITLDIRDLLSHLTIRLQAQLISERVRIAALLENISTAELKEGEHSELLL